MDSCLSLSIAVRAQSELETTINWGVPGRRDRYLMWPNLLASSRRNNISQGSGKQKLQNVDFDTRNRIQFFLTFVVTIF